MVNRKRFFLHNIRKLREAADRVGVGDFRIVTGVDHKAGEQGRVAEAFDKMTQKLLQTDLEREKLQQQLIHAQKLESVGKFAGGVAHDFNNMLMVIQGHSEILMEKISRDNPLRMHLEDI